MLYIVVLVFAVQQSKSAIYMYLYTHTHTHTHTHVFSSLLHLFFYFCLPGSLQSTKLSSLWYTAAFLWLSTMCFTHGGAYMSVLLSQLITPSPSPSYLHVFSLHLCLCCCTAYRFISTVFLDYTQKC